ncbi:hypothetical protein PHSY_000094 [Pseudozyma hubeiensis SY62]|uniref:CFA20 domain-containing protein n=1 Tax=Pseudozyma hubeiensis (strain SY62) TaxID=1305764 RepID=R9P358_PSEHS|nr:hypothetical protein PHSY_000094 [Pseudozyma hubeiensis SY62]GAC92540.1 hypothetical protein PHSY_000094 [Pseudozyma hubeiensis SY62]
MTQGPDGPVLFRDTVQSDSIALFSSTSSQPLALWSHHQDVDLPEDSGIQLVIDATDVIAPNSLDITHESFTLRTEETRRGRTSEPVLHIQSPAVRGTFIRSPPDDQTDLGVRLPYISIQYRAIGKSRHFAFEVGVADRQGRRGIIRVSSFHIEPRLYLPTTSQQVASDDQSTGSECSQGAILHLPLSMTIDSNLDETSHASWQVLTLPLERITKHLSNAALVEHSDAHKSFHHTAFGTFHSVTYVKIHANVRLRRVWCSGRLPDHFDLPEFQLFS